MKFWPFNNEVTHETTTLFGTRERDVAEAPGLEAVPRPNGYAAQLDPACNAQGEARATARVFLIPSAPVDRMQIAVIGLALHGYTMKHHGWVVEMVKS